MTPDLERFLDLATRPLEAVPGEREEAKGELMARVAHGGVPLDLLDLDEPLERLAGSKPANPVTRRVSMLVALLFLIGAVGTVVARQAWEIAMMAQATMMSMMVQYGGSVRAYENDVPLLIAHVRMVAPGLPLGLDGHGEQETAERLARQPDDLAMLQEHLARRLRDASVWSGLTGEEESAIARLDADNALWPLMQVSPHLLKATGSGSHSRRRGGGPVKDEPEFDAALRLFSEAAGKTAYRDRSLELKRRQLDAFPRSRALAEDQIAVGFARLVSPAFGSTYYDRFDSLVEIQCERLVAAGDKDGLVKFSNEWKQVTRMIAASEQVDAGQGGIMSQLKTMGRSISDAFDKLAMPEEQAEAQRWLDAMDRAGHSIYSAAPELKNLEGARINGSRSIPGDLTPAEMLPSRRTELAYMDRALAAFFAVLALVFAGLVGLETCRRARIVKGMARGVMPLFRGADHLWIGGLGLAVPWLWWWSISRLSPLSARDLEIGEWRMLVLLLQPAAGFVFGLVMLLQTARWRWGVRGGFLGLGTSLGWFGWVAAGLTGLAIPAAGMIRYLVLNDDQTDAFLLGVAGMAACGLLWLLWEGIMNLFTPKASALRPNLTTRVMLPWTLAGTLTLLIAAGVATAMERHWFAKDPLLPNWTSGTHMNALDERAAKGFREAMRGL